MDTQQNVRRMFNSQVLLAENGVRHPGAGLQIEPYVSRIHTYNNFHLHSLVNKLSIPNAS